MGCFVFHHFFFNIRSSAAGGRWKVLGLLFLQRKSLELLFLDFMPMNQNTFCPPLFFGSPCNQFTYIPLITYKCLWKVPFWSSAIWDCNLFALVRFCFCVLLCMGVFYFYFLKVECVGCFILFCFVVWGGGIVSDGWFSWILDALLL